MLIGCHEPVGTKLIQYPPDGPTIPDITKAFMAHLDPAILTALRKNDIANEVIKASGLGGGCFNNAMRVTTDKGDLFIKTSDEINAMDMFTAEMKSLSAINKVIKGFAPQAYTCGPLSSGRGGFLVSSYVNLGRMKRSVDAQRLFAHRLAELHLNSRNDSNGKFGFEIDTMCGTTRQDNTWEDDWATFYSKRRLGVLLAKCSDGEIKSLGKKVQEQVTPRLLNVDIQPSLIHGDLWSGNAGWDTDTDQPSIFDSSASYSHNEMELSIMRMFGGFDSEFMDAYHEMFPRLEPLYNERSELYQIYHYLNHFVLFGGGYKSSVVSKMKSLLRWVEQQN